MIKRYLVILLLLLFTINAYAAGEVKTVMGVADSSIKTVMGVAGASVKTWCGKDYNDGDAGCNYDACAAGCTLFYWDCSTASMASNVCSLGDNTAAKAGEIDLTTNAGKLTITDDSDNGGDYYSFTMTEYNLFPAGAFTLELTVNFSVITDNAIIVSVYFDADNSLFLMFDGIDLEVKHEGNNVIETNTFDVNLATATEYQLVITADTVNGMDVSIDGGANWKGVPASSTITTMTHSGSATAPLRIGNASANNLEGTIDNVRIKSGWKAGY